LRQRLSWCAHFFKAAARQYHRPFAARISGLIPPDGVIIDVGAHAGQFTKLFSALVPQGRVFASEPGSYALSILSRMVRFKRLKNVVVAPVGFSDHDAVEVLHVPLKKSGSIGFGLSHIGADTSKRAVQTEEIRLTTLDRFVELRGIARVDFIKADTEGWEANVLAGACNTIRRHRPLVLLEVDGGMLKRARSSPEAVFAAMDGLGYRIFRTDEHDDYRMSPVTKFEGDGDYLFVQEDKAGLLR
jgi:FkbM family methyltransferase